MEDYGLIKVRNPGERVVEMWAGQRSRHNHKVSGAFPLSVPEHGRPWPDAQRQEPDLGAGVPGRPQAPVPDAQPHLPTCNPSARDREEARCAFGPTPSVVRQANDTKWGCGTDSTPTTAS